MDYRMEHDTMGEIAVPAQRRACRNHYLGQSGAQRNNGCPDQRLRHSQPVRNGGGLLHKLPAAADQQHQPQTEQQNRN